METKICTICKLPLPKTEEFFASRKDKKVPYFQSSCRECQKKYRKVHYENNKQKYINKAALYTKKIYNWFQEIKKDLKCENCGEDRFWVLDFHHIDPIYKEDNIAGLVRKGCKQRLIKEMAKCKVLCSNCHRDLHYKEKLADIV